MRVLVLLLALALAGCGSNPVAPVPVELASAPHSLDRGQSGPTAAVEVLSLTARITEATWRDYEYDAEGVGTLVERSGPALEFTAQLDLHGWTLAEFSGSRQFHTFNWYTVVEIDSDGPGQYDGLWDFLAYHDGTNPDLGTRLSVHDYDDEEALHDITHGADITLWASDRDSLTGRAGVRFSIPLEDVRLSEGPVRWKFRAADDYHLDTQQFIGITQGAATRMESSGAR